MACGLILGPSKLGYVSLLRFTFIFVYIMARAYLPKTVSHFVCTTLLQTEVERIMEERMIDGHELTIREQDQIFFQVNPMDAKGRVYGLGSLGPSLTPGGSFSVSQQASSSRENFYTQEQVNELMNPLKQTIDQLLEQQAHITRRMDEMTQQMFAANQQPPPPPGS